MGAKKEISGVKKTNKIRALADNVRIGIVGKSAKDTYKQTQIAQKIKDDNKKIEAIEIIEADSVKANVAMTLNNDDMKIVAMALIYDEREKSKIEKTIHDEKKREEARNLLNSENVRKIVNNVKSKVLDKKLSKLSGKNEYIEYRRKIQDTKFLKEYIEKFIELEGYKRENSRRNFR